MPSTPNVIWQIVVDMHIPLSTSDHQGPPYHPPTFCMIGFLKILHSNPTRGTLCRAKGQGMIELVLIHQ